MKNIQLFLMGTLLSSAFLMGCGSDQPDQEQAGTSQKFAYLDSEIVKEAEQYGFDLNSNPHLFAAQITSETSKVIAFRFFSPTDPRFANGSNELQANIGECPAYLVSGPYTRGVGWIQVCGQGKDGVLE